MILQQNVPFSLLTKSLFKFNNSISMNPKMFGFDSEFSKVVFGFGRKSKGCIVGLLCMGHVPKHIKSTEICFNSFSYIKKSSSPLLSSKGIVYFS